jgi:hypothetical protein
MTTLSEGDFIYAFPGNWQVFKWDDSNRNDAMENLANLPLTTARIQ